LINKLENDNTITTTEIEKQIKKLNKYLEKAKENLNE
jgi:hypothetical protein